jgi:SWIM zinc finger
MQLNITQLEQVIETAKAKAADHQRWLATIEKAGEQLISNPYISEVDDHSLLIASASGNDIYISNGVCQCKAFEFKQPCWHRAAVQLVKRYREAETATPAVSCTERESAILVKRGGNVMKIGYWDL